jgi:hypothetical protein
LLKFDRGFTGSFVFGKDLIESSEDFVSRFDGEDWKPVDVTDFEMNSWIEDATLLMMLG